MPTSPHPTLESAAMMPSEDLVTAGLRQHRAGDLDAAELFYRSALEQDPDHADAWHLLGLVACHSCHHEVALQHDEWRLGGRPPPGRLWPGRTAAFLQALAALLPGVRVQRVGVALVVQLHPGQHLNPEDDSLDVSLHGGRHLPELGGVVITARQGGLAVGAKGHRRDPATVAYRKADRLPRGRLPKAGLGVASRQEGSA